ncbi:MAG TPA: tRNA (adenosine(37)-N6)-threonylcarbamoyltransferase complex ATPase subunit type 1 TsaE [Burkholderiales bacterium]|nr:tRNA (adenosine(37)-N6)-threonylcarbamoyltransferase complex ATPase subunit type 1 TsaE [Burkholderiales bacterium]
MTHPPDHSQPPVKAHWTSTYLPDEGATADLGAKLAAGIGPGMRIYLRGDLGSGKTTLIRGLLRALGVKDTVKSPSYALVELYVVSRLNLYHFDFYRFLDAREFEGAGLADYFHGTGVCLVEWPERAGDGLPRPDLDLALAYAGSGREISVNAYSAAGERCLAKAKNT